MAQDKLFYVGQKAFIEKDGKVLVLQASDGLDLPGGKVQEGEMDSAESLAVSLKREIKEETNLEVEIIEPLFVWPRKSTKYLGEFLYIVGFRCKYISGDVKVSDEHVSFEWIGKNDYEKLNDGSEYFNALKKYFSRQ